MKYEPSILKLAQSLGVNTDAKIPLPESVLDAPAFVQEYAQSFEWPKLSVYFLKGSGERLCGPPYARDSDLDCIILSRGVARMDDAFIAKKRVYRIGFIGNGNYVLLFNGAEEIPHDPMVYLIHHEPEANDEMHEVLRFREFLAFLEAY